MRIRMLLGPVVAGLLLVATAAPAHAAPAAELITPLAPSGFSPAAFPGSADGSLDLDQMANLAGVDKPDGLDRVGWDGAARLWSGPGNQVAMVIAGRTSDAATAQEAAAGALAGALDADGASTFESSLPGVDGAIASKGEARAELVAWSQGPYVSIAVTGTAGDDTHALIADLVTHQSDFLRTRYAVTPVGNTAPDSGIDLRTAGAAGLLLLALVGGGIWLVRRNRPTSDAPLVAAGFGAPLPPGAGVGPDPFAAPVAAAGRPEPAPIPFSREPKPAPAPIPFSREPKPAPASIPFRRAAEPPAPTVGTPGRAPTLAPPAPRPAPPVEATPPAPVENWDDRFGR